MRIPEYLEKDRFLYAGFIQLFLRGTAQIIEEAPDGFFVKDTRSGVYMFAADNGAAAERIISKHKDEPCRIAVAADAYSADALQKFYGFTKRVPVTQGVYEKDEPPHVTAPGLTIRPAREEDVAFVTEHYRLQAKGEIEEITKTGELFIGVNEKGERVGFLGRHREGSMGLLVILPEFRRHGYAGAMESFLVDKTLKEGLIAYGHILIGNDASTTLQNGLGFTLKDDLLYWVYGAPEQSSD